MAYHRETTLVARRGYSGMGSFLDDALSVGKGILKGGVNLYGQQQRDLGAAQQAALQQQSAAEAAAVRSQPPISTTTLAIGGAALLALVLVLRKS